MTQLELTVGQLVAVLSPIASFTSTAMIYSWRGAGGAKDDGAHSEIQSKKNTNSMWALHRSSPYTILLLAIEQLNVKEIISPDIYNLCRNPGNVSSSFKIDFNLVSI
mmetsp:Transcript_6214/g.14059  ORF Transcript_6214/g.14059 Transcript_6214/m.14059 type:complete len:107 (+) Transcript_6214:353-673(+)